MGAWSYESFGNDDACDFASELANSTDLSTIDALFDEVIDRGQEYLEAPEASHAVAAAEAIARLQGNWGVQDAHSEALDVWVKQIGVAPSREMALKARQVLDRVVSEPSELLELWHASPEGEKWFLAVGELRSRIKV